MTFYYFGHLYIYILFIYIILDKYKKKYIPVINFNICNIYI